MIFCCSEKRLKQKQREEKGERLRFPELSKVGGCQLRVSVVQSVDGG